MAVCTTIEHVITLVVCVGFHEVVFDVDEMRGVLCRPRYRCTTEAEFGARWPS